MEGAYDAVAFHRAPVSEVGAQVPAMRVEHMQQVVFGAIRDEVMLEVAQRADLAAGKSARPTDLEPAAR
jgi:hypothetical protein